MKTYTKEESIQLMKASPRSEWKNPYIAKIANGKFRWNADKKQFEFDFNAHLVDDYVWCSVDEIDSMFTNSPDGWFPIIPLPEPSEWIECEPNDATHFMCNGVYTIWGDCCLNNELLLKIGATFHKKKPVEPVKPMVVIEREFEDIHAAYSWMGTVDAPALGIVNNKPFTLRIEQEVVK